MLTPEVPRDVHQLDGVERRAAAPRRGGGVRALAFERVLHGDEPRTEPAAPARAEVRADVREERDVDVAEHPRADEIRLGADELLRDTRPQLQRAGQVLALHDLLHGERRRDVQRHTRVVPFAVPGRALDDRIVIRHARLLRRLRDVVDVRADRDHRLARSPRREPGGRDTGVAALDFEAVLFEDLGEIFRRLELLEAELAEAEDLVDHLLRHHAHRLDVGGGFALQLLDARRPRRRRRRRDGGRATAPALRGDAASQAQNQKDRGECEGGCRSHPQTIHRSVVVGRSSLVVSRRPGIGAWGPAPGCCARCRPASARCRARTGGSAAAPLRRE